MISEKSCRIGNVEVHLLDDGQCVFVAPGGSEDALLDAVFSLPEDMSRALILLSMDPAPGREKFVEYEKLSRDPRVAITVIDGGRA